ncbi:MAG: ATP-dependent zinc metalloprotease FtsH [Anaerolineae bacterium]|nr:ATP-dependent zinc metalloprotease FtsH [Anaerolineae bacterium]
MHATHRVEELNTLTRAKYPIIYIVSWEERRIEDMLRQVALERRKKLYEWTLTNGIMPLDVVQTHPIDPATRDPLNALDFVAHSQEAAIFVLKDFHPFLDNDRGGPDHPVVIRRLRDITNQLKESRKTLIILSPILRFPSDLEKDITVLDYSLPTPDELELSLDRVVRSAREIAGVQLKMHPDERERVLNAARGLTCIEAENVFAKSLVMGRKLDLGIIIAEKEQLISRSQILEYYETVEGFANVGGLGLVKQWLRKRGMAFTEKARRFGLPEPKGLLLLGVQGAGKSLLAKAVASQWQLPLLRLDLGRVFSELVGSSEQNIRTALRLAENVAPCVLWLDEIEKGLAGASGSGSADAGTSARVFGSLLTWMQEKTSPVFVIGTANDIAALPPEVLRKGRFDEIFFVDLPQLQERREIFAIHLARRGRDPLEFALNDLALASDGFSGAEIEQVIIDGLYDAFENERDLTDEDLFRNLKSTIPLSQTMESKITALRQWARTHARPASEPPQPQPVLPRRNNGLRHMELG